MLFLEFKSSNHQAERYLIELEWMYRVSRFGLLRVFGPGFLEIMVIRVLCTPKRSVARAIELELLCIRVHHSLLHTMYIVRFVPSKIRWQSEPFQTHFYTLLLISTVRSSAAC